jgi:hypothetical protein
VLLTHGSDALLVDAPPGIAQALGPDLPRVRAVVLTTGRARSVAGLIALLTALEPHRPADRALPLYLPLGEERPAAVAGVWVDQWDRYPLIIDAQMPGAPLSIGPFELETRAVRVGEPRWHPARVDERVGMALRARADGEDPVAIVLGAAPDRGLARWCAGARLAIVEVGVAPWPPTDAPWRLRPDEAVQVGAGARELWVVGDDGQRLALPDS